MNLCAYDFGLIKKEFGIIPIISRKLRFQDGCFAHFFVSSKAYGAFPLDIS